MTTEDVRAIAVRTLESLSRLEEETANYWEALQAQESIEKSRAYGLDVDPLELETVRAYLAWEESNYGPTDRVEEDREPVWLWLEDALDLVRVVHVRGADEEVRGWEILLGMGGPNIGLELSVDGGATVWAAWWSPREEAHGRLEWLAHYLEGSGL